MTFWRRSLESCVLIFAWQFCVRFAVLFTLSVERHSREWSTRECQITRLSKVLFDLLPTTRCKHLSWAEDNTNIMFFRIGWKKIIWRPFFRHMLEGIVRPNKERRWKPCDRYMWNSLQIEYFWKYILSQLWNSTVDEVPLPQCLYRYIHLLPSYFHFDFASIFVDLYILTIFRYTQLRGLTDYCVTCLSDLNSTWYAPSIRVHRNMLHFPDTRHFLDQSKRNW